MITNQGIEMLKSLVDSWRAEANALPWESSKLSNKHANQLALVITNPDLCSRNTLLDTEPQPVSLVVSVYDKTELDLMGALEYVITAFSGPPGIQVNGVEPTSHGLIRAVNWLHSKYGSNQRR